MNKWLIILLVTLSSIVMTTCTWLWWEKKDMSKNIRITCFVVAMLLSYIESFLFMFYVADEMVLKILFPIFFGYVPLMMSCMVFVPLFHFCRLCYEGIRDFVKYKQYRDIRPMIYELWDTLVITFLVINPLLLFILSNHNDKMVIFFLDKDKEEYLVIILLGIALLLNVIWLLVGNFLSKYIEKGSFIYKYHIMRLKYFLGYVRRMEKDRLSDTYCKGYKTFYWIQKIECIILIIYIVFYIIGSSSSPFLITLGNIILLLLYAIIVYRMTVIHANLLMER